MNTVSISPTLPRPHLVDVEEIVKQSSFGTFKTILEGVVQLKVSKHPSLKPSLLAYITALEEAAKSMEPRVGLDESWSQPNSGRVSQVL